MEKVLFTLSDKFGELFESIHESTEEGLLTKLTGKEPAPVIFFCASSDLGEDILFYESETIELICAESGLSKIIADKINIMIMMLGRVDEVLSREDYFMMATSIMMAEDEINPEDHNSADEMIWSIILIMAVLSSSNMPLISGALKALAAALQSEGWTTPPIMFKEDKLFDLFPYASRENQEMALKHKDRFIHIIDPSTKNNIDNNFDNYFEMHMSIMHFIQQEDEKLSAIIKRIV